jgi:hypothetical protein
MKEADLFRQYGKEAMRWSSCKSTSANEKRALINLACRRPSPSAKGDPPCLLIFFWTIPARNAASH